MPTAFTSLPVLSSPRSVVARSRLVQESPPCRGVPTRSAATRSHGPDILLTSSTIHRWTAIGRRSLMAGTMLEPRAPKSGAALNAAKWTLPLLAAGARWLSSHPEVWEGVKEQAAKLQKASIDKPDGVLATVTVLREQVDYLAQSADDADEERRAKAWAKRLDSCEMAAPLLTEPGATRKEHREMKKRCVARRYGIFV